MACEFNPCSVFSPIALGDVAVILKVYFSNSLLRVLAWTLAVKLLSLSGERHKVLSIQS